MAELTINWESLPKIPQLSAPVVTSDASGASAPANPEAAPRMAADKPYFIYVADPAGTTGFDTVEKVILDDDRVRIAAKAFHAVKMTPDDAKADPVLAEKGGKEVPRLILVTADLKTVKPLEGGSLKLGETWSAMKATANRFYKQDLDALVKDLKGVLLEFDKINKERAVLADKEKRSADKPLSEADKKDMESKKAELDARQKKAEAMKDKLWELKTKDAPALAKAN